ncbi:MAG: hypothetical protein COT17_01065 [Elusimicrobia bacterium CG08_land_8_20_14_0_20_51_18]|nr:MAG: hypothetical protein COT17_01065 [Elusimicrobia bacterium CG08_land_8_20_14_0_20_51_18]
MAPEGLFRILQWVDFAAVMRALRTRFNRMGQDCKPMCRPAGQSLPKGLRGMGRESVAQKRQKDAIWGFFSRLLVGVGGKRVFLS